MLSSYSDSLDLNLHLSNPPKAASMPPEHRSGERDAVKLLVLNRNTGAMTHAKFGDLPDYLKRGDVLVVNTSATVPGRLRARHNGVEFYIHLATKLSDQLYIVERRTERGGPDRRAFAGGSTLEIVDEATGATAAVVRVVERFHPNSRLWKVNSVVDLFQIAQDIGSPIRYHYVPHAYDTSCYQTLFARTPGSAEMPSAGRPFNKRVLRALAERGVKVRSLLLHTGVSSHEVEHSLAEHPVLPEWYDIPAATAAEVNAAVGEGRRVVAVGTTVVRALESAALEDGTVRAQSAWTTHLVTPDTPPRVVSGLVTGMHDSQSSHLALMYAFVRPAWLRAAYQSAVAHEYLWHEFGDASLVL